MWRGAANADFLPAYRSFLGLYWMTALLAWFYAIPVERVFAEEGAMRANLWLLGFVATWRVLLITRVISVIFSVRFWTALFPVMLFADVVVLSLFLYWTPMPVLSFMGGTGRSASEQVLFDTGVMVGVLGVLTLPVWLFGAKIAFHLANDDWTAVSPESDHRVSFPMLGLASSALLVWFFL